MVERLADSQNSAAGQCGASWRMLPAQKGDTPTIKAAAIKPSARCRASWGASRRTPATPQGEENIQATGRHIHIRGRAKFFLYCALAASRGVQDKARVIKTPLAGDGAAFGGASGCSDGGTGNTAQGLRAARLKKFKPVLALYS